MSPEDTLIDADPIEGTQARVAPDRVDDVATRARQQSAADRQFVEPTDFDVGVGPAGVTDMGIRESRRDDIAAREFEATTALDDVDPTRDLVDDGDGFGLSTSAQRRLGARELDAQLPDVDVGVDDITLEDGQAVFEREVRR